MTPSWPKFYQDEARRLAGLNHSAGEISTYFKSLGFDKSRSAVAEYCARQKIKLHSNPGIRPKKFKTTPTQPRKRIKLENQIKIEEDANFEPQQNLLQAQATHCRFILGDVRNFRICGRKALDGYSYCREHKLVCYQ